MPDLRAKALETWLPVPGFEGHYEISDQGNVVSLKYGDRRPMRTPADARGYLGIGFFLAGRRYSTHVHRVVALAFLGPRPEGEEVRHLDGDKANNQLENLAYGTHAENAQDQIRHGSHWPSTRTHCPQNHPYDEANTRIRRGGRYRDCKACESDRHKRHRLANLDRERARGRENQRKIRARRRAAA